MDKEGTVLRIGQKNEESGEEKMLERVKGGLEREAGDRGGRTSPSTRQGRKATSTLRSITAKEDGKICLLEETWKGGRKEERGRRTNSGTEHGGRHTRSLRNDTAKEDGKGCFYDERDREGRTKGSPWRRTSSGTEHGGRRGVKSDTAKEDGKGCL